MLTGCLTTLVTPFAGDGIDEKEFGDFVEWQVAQGVDGLVTCALAGEGPTLSDAERGRIVRLAVEAAAGRVPVVAAAGTNCTSETIELATAAKAAGAAAVLLATPYYSRPTQEGLFQHFQAVARAVDIPVILGNAPLRSGVDLQAQTIESLVAIPAFVGLVDESPDPSRRLVNAFLCKNHMSWFETDAALVDAGRRAPAHGVMSLLANAAPALCLAAAAASDPMDPRRRDALAERLLPLHRAFAQEGEPAAAKYAVSLLRPGFEASVRLPLTRPAPATAALVRSALAELARPIAPAPGTLETAARHARQIETITRGP